MPDPIGIIIDPASPGSYNGVTSRSNGYETARAGAGIKILQSATHPHYAGQAYDVMWQYDYEVRQGFDQIPLDDLGYFIVDSAWLEIGSAERTYPLAGTFTVEAFLRDWSGTVDLGDFVPGGDLDDLTRLAYAAAGTNMALGQGGKGGDAGPYNHDGLPGTNGSVRITYIGGFAEYRTAGSSNWVCPAEVTMAYVECVGAGAGGATEVGGGGGGGGAYAASWVSVTPGNSYAVVVAAGGAADTNGADSTFGTTTVVADGGYKGVGATGGSGGLASASTGTVKEDGGRGENYYAPNIAGGSGGAPARYTPIRFTNVGTALLDALRMPEDRGDYLKILLAGQEQRLGTPPTAYEASDFDIRLVVLHSGHRQVIIPTIEAFRGLSLSADSLTFLVSREAVVNCQIRANIPRPRSNSVKAFDFNRVFMGTLPGVVRVSEQLDGPDELRVDIPWRYGKADGSSESRVNMITQGWYLEYDGNWYRTSKFTKQPIGNKLPVIATSAEFDLDRFLTNYGQVPFAMKAHTPSEIMEAVLSGQPECDWYNGDFSLLDDTGFPLGWSGEDWEVYSPDGEITMETTVSDTSLVSEGVRHTAGAQIKPILDVYVGPYFAGILRLKASWQNALGVESHRDEAAVSISEGEWYTFAAPEWWRVRNERCVLSLEVLSNTALETVRVRRVRFRQNEEETGWSYHGELDTRTADVAYNDSLFVKYGAWAATPGSTEVFGNDSLFDLVWLAGQPDHKYGSRFTLPEAQTFSEFTVGVVSTPAGDIQMKLHIYDFAGALVSSSEELTVGMYPNTRTFTFSPSVTLPAGGYWLVLHGNGPFYFLAKGFDGVSADNADTYADGPSDPAGFTADGELLMYAYATYTSALNGYLSSSTPGDVLARPFTGDLVTVRFESGGAGALADILVDGVYRATDLDVSAARNYEVTELNRFRPHILEIIVKAGTVKVAGLTQSTENRIAVSWLRLGVYQASLELQDLVGGEFEFDTRDKVIHHLARRGIDLTETNLLWFREGVNLVDFEPAVEQVELGNRAYGAGYGDGAFQIGCVIDADVTDDDGNTSQDRFGVLRFAYRNRDAKDLATLAEDTLREANARALPVATYTSHIEDRYATYLHVGDTCRVTHTALSQDGATPTTKTLRVRQIDRASDSNVCGVTWGARPTQNPTTQYAAFKRTVDQLMRRG